jgi:3'-phosphoadenosine 5'-phosphosulfate sulfotransferase (PAPS reductase)/FAD synthetase
VRDEPERGIGLSTAPGFKMRCPPKMSETAFSITRDLPERLAYIRADMKEEYLQEHAKPWIVGFSGGKDSTILIQLVIEMLLELPPIQAPAARSCVVE